MKETFTHTVKRSTKLSQITVTSKKE